MKVAQKKPIEIKSAVYVSATKYELWHSKPVKLGEINRDGNWWYTEDGMRFASNRDALEYCVRVSELIRKGDVPIERMVSEAMSQTRVARKKRIEKRRQIATQRTRQGATLDREELQGVVMQNHPRFQEFLEFLEYRDRSILSRKQQKDIKHVQGKAPRESEHS